MAYFTEKKVVVRDPNKLGVVDGNQVYDIIKETTDDFREFHAIEPAIVQAVHINPTSPTFPTRDLDGTEIPDYSKFGTIDAVFKRGTEVLDSYIKPLSNNIVTYPLKGELVNVAKYDGEYYYSMPLNLNQNINMNRLAGERGDNTVTPQRTKFNRRVLSGPGDTVVQGRFGNHIKLGSDSIYENPSIRIVCGQSQKLKNVQVKNIDSSFLQVEDINNDGSSFYMTSGPEQLDNFKIAAPTLNFPSPRYLYGNQIILNSDRLIFQAKGKVYPGSQPGADTNPIGCIHMIAADDLIMTAGDRVVIEVPNPSDEPTAGIFLGMDGDASNTGVAKGGEVIWALKEIVSTLSGVITLLSRVEIEVQEGAMKPLERMKSMKRDLKAVRDYLPDIESKVVRMTWE
tara:strand:+ start:34 stop:1227 length:1194 start_codon:yes stop_codon:yes gene_type:complete